MKSILIIIFCLLTSFQAQASFFDTADMAIDFELDLSVLDDNENPVLDLDLQDILLGTNPTIDASLTSPEASPTSPQETNNPVEAPAAFSDDDFLMLLDQNLLDDPDVQLGLFLFPLGVTEIAHATPVSLLYFESIVQIMPSLQIVEQGHRRYLNISPLLLNYILVHFDSNSQDFLEILEDRIRAGTLSVAQMEDMIKEAKQLGGEDFAEIIEPLTKKKFIKLEVSCRRTCSKRSRVPHTEHSPPPGKKKVVVLDPTIEKLVAIKVTVDKKEVKPRNSAQTSPRPGLAIQAYPLGPAGSFTFDGENELAEDLVNDFLHYHIPRVGISNILDIPAMQRNLAQFLHDHEKRFTFLTHCVKGRKVCRHYAQYAETLLSKVLDRLVRGLKVESLSGYFVDHEWHFTADDGHSWNLVTLGEGQDIRHWFFDPLNYGLVEIPTQLIAQIAATSHSPAELDSAIEASLNTLEGVTPFLRPFVICAMEWLLGPLTEHSLYHPNNGFFLDKICEVVLTHFAGKPGRLPIEKKPTII